MAKTEAHPTIFPLLDTMQLHSASLVIWWALRLKGQKSFTVDSWKTWVWTACVHLSADLKIHEICIQWTLAVQIHVVQGSTVFSVSSWVSTYVEGWLVILRFSTAWGSVSLTPSLFTRLTVNHFRFTFYRILYAPSLPFHVEDTVRSQEGFEAQEKSLNERFLGSQRTVWREAHANLPWTVVWEVNLYCTKHWDLWVVCYSSYISYPN